MMADFISICILSISMFFGCALAGWIPLAFSLSPRKVQLFTIFGAGLLVGTALAVIIPEGVETMYSHNAHGHAEVLHKEGKALDSVLSDKNSKNDGSSIPAYMEVHVEHSSEKHEHSMEGPHRAIGLALLIGFVFMLLVDQLGGSHSHSHNPEIRLDDLNQSKVGNSRTQQPDQRSKGYTATIGLVVHAAADGIALGAAASTDRQDLQFIVFIAIMLHKAPAAFGLVAFLVHEGFELRKVKKHLLIFSLAAPILAVLTFLFLTQKDKQLLVDVNATGIAMLFSAGTFLYVATVHVLPEVTHSGNDKGLHVCEVLVLVSGSLFPLILNLSHSHG